MIAHMSAKRLSIIVPFYNVEKYISQCLDSIYSQDIPEDEYEVICVDDCSPDGSRAIVEEYAKAHKNLKLVINEQNRKLGGARNAGMDVACGEYIWFIDSDDFIEESILGRLLKLAEEAQLDVLHFDYELYPNNNNQGYNAITETQIMSGADLFFDKRFTWSEDHITAWRKLYRKRFLRDNNIDFAEHIMFEDNDFAFLVFAYAKRAKHVKLQAYYYRQNPESITRTKINTQHISYWMELSHRLKNVMKRLKKGRMDERFQPVLSRFIRYILSNALSQYENLSEEEKIAAKIIIRHFTDSTILPFISKKKYMKIKLGLL